MKLKRIQTMHVWYTSEAFAYFLQIKSTWSVYVLVTVNNKKAIAPENPRWMRISNYTIQPKFHVGYRNLSRFTKYWLSVRLACGRSRFDPWSRRTQVVIYSQTLGIRCEWVSGVLEDHKQMFRVRSRWGTLKNRHWLWVPSIGHLIVRFAYSNQPL